jgi:hypothetical protein
MASAPKIPRFPRRLPATIREPGYTRTGQQDTDAILQDEVTRTRPCPRHERAVPVAEGWPGRARRPVLSGELPPGYEARQGFHEL